MDQKALYDDLERLKAAVPLTDLDPICEALESFQRKHPQFAHGRVLPNRLVALAAVRLMEEAEREAWERD